MSRLHGTWQAEGPGGGHRGPVIIIVVLALLMAGSGAAAAIEAAATMLLIAAVAVAVLTAAGLAAAVVFLRRYSRRGAEQLAVQAEALRASQTVRTVAAPAPPMIVNHFHGGTHLHLHLTPGHEAGLNTAFPLGDAITIEERNAP